jgi:hypothetical protein
MINNIYNWRGRNHEKTKIIHKPDFVPLPPASANVRLLFCGITHPIDITKINLQEDFHHE